MSRPKINEQNKRIVQVNIRLTADENTRLNGFAAASGLSPANWIRQKAFTGKNPSVKMSPLDASIYQELKRMGVNLNQSVHKLNVGEKPGGIFLKLLFELKALLDKIYKLLLHDRQHDQG